MITINFPEDGQILAFDGVVLEVFYGSRSARYHIGHIKNVEVKTDRKGNQSLSISIGAISETESSFSFGAESSAKVIQLVDEVKKAKATHSFE